jgi:phospholipase C
MALSAGMRLGAAAVALLVARSAAQQSQADDCAARIDEAAPRINAACCPGTVCEGTPSACSAKCAEAFLPLYATCAESLAGLPQLVPFASLCRDRDRTAQLDPERVAAIHRLKAELHTLAPEETARRFDDIWARYMLERPPPRPQNKIDHFVVLLMENRGADHMFGCFGLDGFDGVPATGEPLPRDGSNPARGVGATVRCGTAEYVCDKSPGFSPWDGLFAQPNSSATCADSEQGVRQFCQQNGLECRNGCSDVAYSCTDATLGAQISALCPVTCRRCAGGPSVLQHPYGPQGPQHAFGNLAGGGADGAIKMFSREQLPVKAAVSDEFAVFNKFYAAVPSWSTPNHDFTQSATSCGLRDNRMYSECGGSTEMYPQMTMYLLRGIYMSSF